jgi:hypothetical protein
MVKGQALLNIFQERKETPEDLVLCTPIIINYIVKKQKKTKLALQRDSELRDTYWGCNRNYQRLLNEAVIIFTSPKIRHLIKRTFRLGGEVKDVSKDLKKCIYNKPFGVPKENKLPSKK